MPSALILPKKSNQVLQTKYHPQPKYSAAFCKIERQGGKFGKYSAAGNFFFHCYVASSQVMSPVSSKTVISMTYIHLCLGSKLIWSLILIFKWQNSKFLPNLVCHFLWLMGRGLLTSCDRYAHRNGSIGGLRCGSFSQNVKFCCT